MRREELDRVEATVRDANPVPHPGGLTDSVESAAVTLLIRGATRGDFPNLLPLPAAGSVSATGPELRERSRAMDTIEHTEGHPTNRPARWRVAAIAVAAAVVVVVAVAGVGLLVTSDGDGLAVAIELPAEIPADFPMPLPEGYEALTVNRYPNIDGARESLDVRVVFELSDADLEALVAFYEDWYAEQGIEPNTQRFDSAVTSTVSMKANLPPGSDLSQAGDSTVSVAITATTDKPTVIGLESFTFFISEAEYMEWVEWAREEGILQG